ncbi:MAG: phosphocholine cytidylyltransferase family protein [Nitrospirota bacterium]|nr:MAG: phosphocholine cytidylyltransferase family protein [Nitrospirota bacterium]
MKAIILAAGVGKRLRTLSNGVPKCLISIGGRTLLSRHLDNLARVGIHQVVVVVGYEHHLIREASQAEPYDGTIRYLMNDQYERGSITSFWKARVEFDDDVIIMDADVLYHPTILRRLVESPLENALLMDETVQQQTEECMVAVRNERVISLSKSLPANYDCAGEGVGFLKVRRDDLLHLVDSVRPHIENGQVDREYEDALQDFFRTVFVGCERIGGLPWIEIDFPEDIQRAETEILPLLSEGANTEFALGHHV